MKTILVVDDSIELRNTVVEILQFEGFNVIAASNGQVGFEMAAQYLPDLVLSDLMMPVLDGYGLLELLRQHAETASIPVFFFSGVNDVRKHIENQNLANVQFITKPFDVKQFLALVSKTLRN